MKKTVNINLSGRVFYIDEDAYARLRKYLDRLEKYFSKQEEGKEIILDIESRIAELFESKLSNKNAVVNEAMVEEVIRIMGQPEDFDDGGSDAEENTSYQETYFTKARKRLYRDVDNRVLGGVCSGIAAYLNTDPVFIRIIFAILPFLSFGIIIPVYIILWIVVPAAYTTAQKLEMRGENVTIKNIEKAIRNEYEDVKEHFSKVRESKAYKKGESWWNRLTKRDQNLLIIVAVICGSVLMSNILNLHVFNFNDAFITNVDFHPMYFSHMIHFPGLLGIIFILLLVGLVFKAAFKVVLYLIAFLFVAVIGLKIIGFILGGVYMFC